MIKYKSSGEVENYKARLVAKAYVEDLYNKRSLKYVFN